MELQPIVHVWTHTDSDLVDLTITTTTKSQHGKPITLKSEVVHTTSEHPFLTTENGFVPAGKVKTGMHILRADGSVGVITNERAVHGTKVMYNLEVAQDHTFTVGDGQWVVHNECSEQDHADLRSALNSPVRMSYTYNAHHVIPCSLRDHPLVQRAGDNFGFNSVDNGIGLPTDPLTALRDDMPQHGGPHLLYNRRIGQLLDITYDDLLETYGTHSDIPSEVAAKALISITELVKAKINGAGGACDLNGISFD